MSIARSFFGFLLIFVCCSFAQAEEGQLLWKFQAGNQHYYRMTQSMDMEMVVDATGRKIESGSNQILDMTWEITKVDEQGLATVSQKVNRVRMDMHAPGQAEMQFDTSAEEAPTGFAAMLAPLYKVLTKEPLSVTYTPRGEIKDLQVPEALTKALQGLPGAAMMREMFSEQGFKQMMQQSSMVLPETADLQPGYEWTRTTKVKNAQFGEININTTYNYRGKREVEGKSFEAFGVKLEMEFGNAPELVQLKIVSQESEGEILFDREEGRLESSALKQKTVMSTSTGGQKVTQKIVVNNLMERLDKPEELGDPEESGDAEKK